MFQDGDVRYRDNGTGPSAFLGHTFVDGDDTLVVFHPRLDPSATGWTVTSADDPDFGTVSVTPCRKSKPMHWDHTLTAELDHWLYLRLPRPMKEGCTYTVHIPAASGSDILLLLRGHPREHPRVFDAGGTQGGRPVYVARRRRRAGLQRL